MRKKSHISLAMYLVRELKLAKIFRTGFCAEYFRRECRQ